MRLALRTYRIIVPSMHAAPAALVDLPREQTDDEFRAFLEEKGFVEVVNR